ncbi:MAG: CotH kinase family protein [Lachnospiraceae bacterium]|nr:CotH kinase family protein [Lachnospiraceae bacterium]
MKYKLIRVLWMVTVICCIFSACSKNSTADNTDKIENSAGKDSALNISDASGSDPEVNKAGTASDTEKKDAASESGNNSIENDNNAEAENDSTNQEIGDNLADTENIAAGDSAIATDEGAIDAETVTDTDTGADTLTDNTVGTDTGSATGTGIGTGTGTAGADSATADDKVPDVVEGAGSESATGTGIGTGTGTTGADSATADDKVPDAVEGEGSESATDTGAATGTSIATGIGSSTGGDTISDSKTDKNTGADSGKKDTDSVKNPGKKPANVFKGEGDDKYLSVIESQKTGYLLPIINIYTEGNQDIVSRSQYINCEVFTGNVDDELMLYNASGRVRTRGNATDYYGDEEKARTEQVPYRIKFDKKQSMLGLNNGAKCKNWVLLKCDYNVIGDEIAFRIGRSIFRNDNYVSDGRLVQVFVNGVSKGCYCLCEQTQVNSHRVNVYECPENYMGTDIGYLVELDNYWETPYFIMDYDKEQVTDLRGKSTIFNRAAYSIKSDVYSAEQKKYIEKYIKAVYSVMVKAYYHDEYYVLNKNFNLKEANPDKLAKEYDLDKVSLAEAVTDKVLDLDAAVDMYIIHDIVRSYDVGEGSFYMCVDFSEESTIKKLRFTSPWDFNWAYFENPEKVGCFAGTIWDERITKVSGIRYNPWFIILMTQDWFRKRVSDRLSELVNNGVFEGIYKQEEKMLKKYSADIRKAPNIYYESGLNQIKDIQKRVNWMYQEYCINNYKNIIADTKSESKAQNKK